MEIESKFTLGNPGELRKRLRALHAKFEGKIKTTDFILDFGNGALKKKQELLRVRDIKGEGVLVTFKGKKSRGRLAKIREELQFETSAGAAEVVELFERLGLKKILSFSKETERWKLGKAKITIDALPEYRELGMFFEIEADSEKAIEFLMKKLGVPRKDLVEETYVEMVAKKLLP